MENRELNFVSFDEILFKIKRRKWVLISCIVLSLLPAFIYNQYSTPKYKASAIVSFERFSNDNMLDLDFASASYEETFISNRITELKTWTFAENVFNATPDYYRRSFLLPASNPPGFDPERYVISQIQEHLSVSQAEKGSNLLVVSFESESPELAKVVTNTAVDVLQDRSLNYRRQEFASLKEFIDRQIEVVQEKLDAAEDALSKFKSNDNITSLEDESREVLRRITQTEILYNQIQTDRKSKERQLAEIRKIIDERKQATLNSSSETSSPMIAKLREQLVELEVESASLQIQGYDQTHPRRQELDKEIKGIRENLLELTTSVVSDKNLGGIVDPLANLSSYVEKAAGIEIEIRSLQAQQNHLEGTLESYNSRLNNLSTMDARLYGLIRDQEVNNKLYVRLLEEREQARLREAAEIGTMHMLERAQTPLAPVKPRKKLNLVIAIFIGASIGLLLTQVKDSYYDVPHIEEELEAVLNLPVVASIPRVSGSLAMSFNGHSEEGLVEAESLGIYQDAYANLWHCLQILNRDKIKSVMIASATPGEGKSTVAANLAKTAAQIGERTLLIDGDLRKPMLSRFLEVADAYGLSDLVSDGMPFEEEFSTSLTKSVLLDIGVEGLKFLSAGTLRNSPGHIIPGHFWALPKLRKALTPLMEDFDLVVIDSPPVLGLPDSLSIASYVDGVILCVEAEQVDKTLLARAKKILAQTNTNLIGVVWNKVDPAVLYGSYQYGGYY